MVSKLAGRLPLADMVAAQLDMARIKLAAAEPEEGKKEEKDEKKVEKLVKYEKKEHGGKVPSVMDEEKEHEEKKASAEDTEKLAEALEYAGELLIKQAEENNAEAVETNDNRSPGGNGAKYPVNGVLVKNAVALPKPATGFVGLYSRHPKTVTTGLLAGMGAVGGAVPGALIGAVNAEKGKKMKGALKGGAIGAAGGAAIAGGATTAIMRYAQKNNPREYGKRIRKATENMKQASAEDSKEDAEYRRLAKGHGRIGATLGGLHGAFGGASLGGLRYGGKGAVIGGLAGGALGAGAGYLSQRGMHWAAGKVAPAREKKASAEGTDALVYILGKVAEAHGGGETLDDKAAPVPSNPGRQLIASNQAVIDAKRVQAKSPRKAELAEVLNEPAMTRSTDNKVYENLRNATNGGVKIAAAKALLAKVAAEGCTCGGKDECRNCKMKAVLAKKKAE